MSRGIDSMLDRAQRRTERAAHALAAAAYGEPRRPDREGRAAG